MVEWVKIMDAEAINILKIFIYNQLYAAAMYEEIANMTNDPKEKQQLLNFSVACTNNANYLDRFYQYTVTSSYNPIIEEPHITGTYEEMLLYMLEYEGLSHYGFNNSAFQPNAPTQYHDLLLYVCNTCNTRGLLLIHMHLT